MITTVIFSILKGHHTFLPNKHNASYFSSSLSEFFLILARLETHKEKSHLPVSTGIKSAWRPLKPYRPKQSRILGTGQGNHTPLTMSMWERTGTPHWWASGSTDQCPLGGWGASRTYLPIKCYCLCIHWNVKRIFPCHLFQSALTNNSQPVRQENKDFRLTACQPSTEPHALSGSSSVLTLC